MPAPLRVACTLLTVTSCLGSLVGPHAHLGSRRGHPGVALRSPAMSADTLDAFHEWLEERDLLATAKVTGARVEGFGVCLAAKEALQPGDAVLAVPRRLHLTAKQAEGTQLGKALEALGVVDESVVLAMVLLEQMALGDASPWARYLALLPTVDELTLPLLWPDAERAALLEGSHLLGCVDGLLTDLRQQWATIEAAIITPNPATYPASVYRFEGLAWATAAGTKRPGACRSQACVWLQPAVDINSSVQPGHRDRALPRASLRGLAGADPLPRLGQPQWR